MKNPKINYTMVGGFVLAMIVALVVVVSALAGRGGPTDVYVVVYDNVSGVAPGTKVYYEGYPIGRVARITPERMGAKTRFRVGVDVVRGWQIPVDSRAQVAASGLLSAVAIDIRAGQNERMLAPGDEIPASPGGNIFVVVSDVAAQVSDLSQNALKPLLATVNQVLSGLGGALQAQAPEVMANLLVLSRDLAARGPQISANVEDLTTQLTRAGRQVNRVLSDGNAAKVDRIVANADISAANVATLTRDLNASRQRMDEALAALDRLVAGNRDGLDQSLKDLRYTLSTVSRNIDSVTYNLDGAARNMNEFSRQIRENPGALLGGTKPARDVPRK